MLADEADAGSATSEDCTAAEGSVWAGGAIAAHQTQADKQEIAQAVLKR
jgi:hypothetical protein